MSRMNVLVRYYFVPFLFTFLYLCENEGRLRVHSLLVQMFFVAFLLYTAFAAFCISLSVENEKAHAGRNGRTRLARPNSRARTGTRK